MKCQCDKIYVWVNMCGKAIFGTSNMRLPRDIALVHMISCREVRSAKALHGNTSVDLPGHKQTVALNSIQSKQAESLMRLLLTPPSLSQFRRAAIVSMPDNFGCQRHFISSQ